MGPSMVYNIVPNSELYHTVLYLVSYIWYRRSHNRVDRVHQWTQTTVWKKRKDWVEWLSFSKWRKIQNMFWFLNLFFIEDLLKGWCDFVEILQTCSRSYLLCFTNVIRRFKCRFYMKLCTFLARVLHKYNCSINLLLYLGVISPLHSRICLNLNSLI